MSLTLYPKTPITIQDLKDKGYLVEYIGDEIYPYLVNNILRIESSGGTYVDAFNINYGRSGGGKIMDSIVEDFKLELLTEDEIIYNEILYGED